MLCNQSKKIEGKSFDFGKFKLFEISQVLFGDGWTWMGDTDGGAICELGRRRRGQGRRRWRRRGRRVRRAAFDSGQESADSGVRRRRAPRLSGRAVRQWSAAVRVAQAVDLPGRRPQFVAVVPVLPDGRPVHGERSTSVSARDRPLVE